MIVDKEQVKKSTHEENISEKGYYMCCGNLREKRRNSNQHKAEDR